MSWNPDAIPPASGDVYQRYADGKSSWWLVAGAVALVVLAVWVMRL